MSMYIALVQAIVSNLYATVLQKHDAWKLVYDGLSIWHALCIFRSHNLKYTSELTSAKQLSNHVIRTRIGLSVSK
jgi:hypothetical protein